MPNLIWELFLSKNKILSDGQLSGPSGWEWKFEVFTKFDAF